PRRQEEAEPEEREEDEEPELDLRDVREEEDRGAREDHRDRDPVLPWPRDVDPDRDPAARVARLPLHRREDGYPVAVPAVHELHKCTSPRCGDKGLHRPQTFMAVPLLARPRAPVV